ncbi:MAG: glycosyltransferase [Actinobacteria bacterium]|nr:glycosyltransferase [Actinomycetota bacterium]
MIKKPSKISLSIIVPTFNEEEGISNTIIQIFKDARRNEIREIVNAIEVIVIDDGSSDDTSKLLNKLEKYKIKIIKHKTNKGLGASIITGVKNATKEYITYLPADGQAFLREITKGLRIAPKGDLILTYRGIRADYNPYRHLLSNTLMIFMKIFFGLNYKDYNWVHIYNKKLFDNIKTKSQGVFFLAEIVTRASKGGFKILEAEARYNSRSSGYYKNARLSVALTTLKDLFKLWIELMVK